MWLNKMIESNSVFDSFSLVESESRVTSVITSIYSPFLSRTFCYRLFVRLSIFFFFLFFNSSSSSSSSFSTQCFCFFFFLFFHLLFSPLQASFLLLLFNLLSPLWCWSAVSTHSGFEISHLTISKSLWLVAGLKPVTAVMFRAMCSPSQFGTTSHKTTIFEELTDGRRWVGALTRLDAHEPCLLSMVGICCAFLSYLSYLFTVKGLSVVVRGWLNWYAVLRYPTHFVVDSFILNHMDVPMPSNLHNGQRLR